MGALKLVSYLRQIGIKPFRSVQARNRLKEGETTGSPQGVGKQKGYSAVTFPGTRTQTPGIERIIKRSQMHIMKV